jgi:arsenite-transporting ATPase
LLLGGKGGVGKTTGAAALAIRAAADDPQRPVLLLSVDPAHSLGDVLGVPLGDDARPVPGAPPNIKAREIDAAGRFDLIKKEYAGAIDQLFGRLGEGNRLDLSADREAMRDLLELAPPGLDELMALVEVSNALDSDGFTRQLVVLDTAPTGHALRLLEMPELVHDWVKALMSIVLKYQPVVGVGELGAVLLRMSQGLRRLRSLLRDRSRSAFLVVTRPAALPVAETHRLLAGLAALDIHVPAIVVNAWGAGTCGSCTTIRGEQKRALTQLRAAVPRRSLVIAPSVMPPPHGPESLRAWGGQWVVR